VGDFGRSGDMSGCVIDLPIWAERVGVTLGCTKPELGGVRSVLGLGRDEGDNASCSFEWRSFAAVLSLRSVLDGSSDPLLL
jgi:hypothetical protein